MKRIFIFVMAIILIALTVCNSYATNSDFLKLIDCNETYDNILQKISIKCIDEEPIKKPVKCFGVAGRYIAIGVEDGEQKTVVIYDTQGEFQKAYTFKSEGSFGISFDKNILQLYLLRSNVVLSIDIQNNTFETYSFKYDNKSNEYIKHEIKAKKKTVDGKTYEMSNGAKLIDFISWKYSKIYMTDENEKCVVFYDAKTSYSSFLIVTVFVVIILSCNLIRKHRLKYCKD